MFVILTRIRRLLRKRKARRPRIIIEIAPEHESVVSRIIRDNHQLYRLFPPPADNGVDSGAPPAQI